jgi:quercetin 2,3-dioxygenase
VAVRVVPGEIDAKDATTRAAIPTSAKPRWPPLLRVAETIATPRRRFPPHSHEGVEVLTYVIEGSGTYEHGPANSGPLTAGAIKLLTAPTKVAHSINPGRGQTVRWFSVVISLPPNTPPNTRLQSSTATDTGEQPDGTVVRHLVGPHAAVTSAAGLECEAIEFRSAGTAFRKVGHDRIAVCYALSGHGTVDGNSVDGGEVAFIEDAAGIALQGTPGLRSVLVSAPRPA